VALPWTPAAFKGPTSKGRGSRGKRKDGKRSEKKGKYGEGKDLEGKEGMRAILLRKGKGGEEREEI